MRAPIAEQYGRRLRRRAELERAALEAPLAHRPVEVWASRDFLVQVFDDGPAVRITVNRTTLDGRGRWRDGITWDELHEIKTTIGRGDRWAVEVFPPVEHLVDVANMRHLFLLDDRPAFGWLTAEEAR